MKNEIILMTLAGALVIATLEEKNHVEHSHETIYESTPKVQMGVPTVTGSYFEFPAV